MKEKNAKRKKVSVQMMKTQTAELVPLTEIEIYSQFSVVSRRSPRGFVFYSIISYLALLVFVATTRLCT
jgi:hypothetical protein